MSGASWVAGTVRARALARRRLGRGGARAIAASAGVAAAVEALAQTPYRHDVRRGQDLAEAERAVGATLLWHLRVLAGWLPRRGVEPLRTMAAWFELDNIEWHARYLGTGVPAPPPYRLGALAIAWPRVARSSTVEALRAELGASVWADPGAATLRGIALGLRLSWAQRMVAALPAAQPWAAGAVALLVARERFVAREQFVAGSGLDAQLAQRAAVLIGERAVAADTLAELAATARTPARWACADLADTAELWRAEARWWGRLEQDAFGMLGAARFGLPAVAGAALLLAVDAWRVRAALACAARPGAREVFDAVVFDALV
jgi:hypothetical protein